MITQEEFDRIKAGDQVIDSEGDKRYVVDVVPPHVLALYNSEEELLGIDEIYGVIKRNVPERLILFAEDDLVSFGHYLLSEERESRLRETNNVSPDALPYEDRFRFVHDSDVANWKQTRRVEVYSNNVRWKLKGTGESGENIVLT